MITANLEDRFGTSDVARMAQVTFRQIQWWDEQGLVTPLLIGHRRTYELEDVTEILLISLLRKRGMSLQNIRHAMRQLTRRIGMRLGRAVRGKVYLLMNEQFEISVFDDPQAVCDALERAETATILLRIPNVGHRAAAKTGQ